MCLRFYPYPEPKKAEVSFVGLSKSGRLHPASPHRQDPCPAPRRGQRRGRLLAYAVLPYIFPEYADCQKTLVGASIARPCPFACEKNLPGKGVAAPSWRATNGRPYARNKAGMQFIDGLGFPLGGSCQRLRPLTDEGRARRHYP